MIYDEDPSVALNQFKEVAFRANTKARTKTSTTLRDKLFVTCTALRAHRNGLTDTIRRCCETWAPVARCFDTHFTECINLRALFKIIESVTRDNILGA